LDGKKIKDFCAQNYMYIKKYYRNEKNTTFTIINIIRKKNANTKNHKYNTC